MHFVYSEKYSANIGPHVFPIEKYRWVVAGLRQAGVGSDAFVEPALATREQLALVHTSAYLGDLGACRWTRRTLFSELPLTPEIVDMFRLFCGGTIRAAELAMSEGVSVHIGGGFHHAFADKAEGFCYLNDLAVAIRVLQAQKRIGRAAVLDCDLHQGNGTARIFRGDSSVCTFSIHQENLYPIKERSSLDIPLADGVGDAEYIQHLHRNVPALLDQFRPELILYQAGVDPYQDDQLGALRLTKAGLGERDQLILQWARQRRIPTAVTLGGGYARQTQDTVDLHLQTCLAAWQLSQPDAAGNRQRGTPPSA